MPKYAVARVCQRTLSLDRLDSSGEIAKQQQLKDTSLLIPLKENSQVEIPLDSSREQRDE